MKGKSILEVIIVFALTSLFSWWLGAQLQSLDFEMRRWISGFIFIAISLIIMALTRRPWREYGLTLKDWRLSFDVGMTGYVARFIPVGAVFALVLLGVQLQDVAGRRDRVRGGDRRHLVIADDAHTTGCERSAQARCAARK